MGDWVTQLVWAKEKELEVLGLNSDEEVLWQLILCDNLFRWYYSLDK